MDFDLFVDSMIFLIATAVVVVVAWAFMDVVFEIRQANTIAGKITIIRDQGATAWINQLPTYHETLERISRDLARFPQWRFDMEYEELNGSRVSIQTSHNWKSEGF